MTSSPRRVFQPAVSLFPLLILGVLLFQPSSPYSWAPTASAQAPPQLPQPPSWISSIDVSRPVAGGTGSVTLKGTWNNGCAPDAISHALTSDRVDLEITQPGLDVLCTGALTEWSLTEEFGPGTNPEFSIYGSLVSVNPANRSERQPLRGPNLLAEIAPLPQAEFQGLGKSNDLYLTTASDVSSDGRVVAGTFRLPPNANAFITSQAFAWAPETGTIPLGLLPGGIPGGSHGKTVSGDGNLIAGQSGTADFGAQQSFFWKLGTGMQAIPYAKQTTDSFDRVDSAATGASHDGSVIVGYEQGLPTDVPFSFPNRTSIAYRWTAETGPVDLGHLSLPHADGENIFVVGGMTSESTDVSANGHVVVGNSGPIFEPCLACDFAFEPRFTQPFHWTEDTGMVGLGHLARPGDEAPILRPSPLGLVTVANAVSADGNTIVGSSTVYRDGGLAIETDTRAYRWTAETGMANLGELQGHPIEMIALSAVDTNEDGSIVVGNASKFLNQDENEFPDVDENISFIWDAQRGMRPLEDVLKLDYGLDLDGWQLGEVTAISDDGSTIVGNGINPDGELEAWRTALGHSYVAGDIDFDGDVDLSDLRGIAQNLGMSVGNGQAVYWAHGDFDADGLITSRDFAAARANLIPEPSSFALLLLAGGLLTLHHRRKK